MGKSLKYSFKGGRRYIREAKQRSLSLCQCESVLLHDHQPLHGPLSVPRLRPFTAFSGSPLLRGYVYGFLRAPKNGKILQTEAASAGA